MAIEVVALTNEQCISLLGLDEGHFLDFKAVDVAPAKLSRSLAAFANADGGELFIGVAEDKATATTAWAGFASQESANGHIQALEQTFPLSADSFTSSCRCRASPDSCSM